MLERNHETIFNILLGIFIVLTVAIGGWKLERWLHYKLSYESQVQEEIQKAVKPLQKELSKLEARIVKLETK